MVIASIVVGVAALAAFVFAESRVHSPMMPLGIFRSRSFAGCIVVSQDHDLIRRCRTLGIKVVGLEMDDLAKLVNEMLKKEFS